MMYAAADKLRAVDREINIRRRVYMQRVSEGKMTQKLADEQIAIFEAIAEDYRVLAAKERLI